MTEKHFIIQIDEQLVIRQKCGKLSRNANGSQWIDVELDGWKLTEGEALFIEFSHKDEDTELTTFIGPLYLVYNAALGRFVTLAPPELLSSPGRWNFSIELRSYKNKDADIKVTTVITVTDSGGNILSTTSIEKSKADTPVLIGEEPIEDMDFDSLTSDVDWIEVVDSIAGASGRNEYVKESELISAAKVFYENIDKAETANSVALEALQAAETAQNAAETAQAGAESAEAAAAQQAEEAASSANKAETEASRAADDAAAATSSATEAQASALAANEASENAAEHEAAALAALMQTENKALAAAESAETAGNWAKQAAELFATHSIKISTEFATVADLPAEGNSQTIYFIPNGGIAENSFDEYVWVEFKGSYEKIGSTAVDLSGYVTKLEHEKDVTSLETADDALQDALLEEATVREQAVESLQSDISVETTARGNADTTLQNAISEETAAREEAVTEIVEQIVANREVSTKNLYNLSSFDTYASNGDGTGTITRKTGRIDFKEFLAKNLISSIGTFPANNIIGYTDSVLPVALGTVITEISCNNKKVTAIESGYFPNTTTPYLEIYTNKSWASIDEFVEEMQGTVIEYKALKIIHAEQVIENQPIHTLTQDGENWLNNEFRKGLNLWNNDTTKLFTTTGNTTHSLTFEISNSDTPWEDSFVNSISGSISETGIVAWKFYNPQDQLLTYRIGYNGNVADNKVIGKIYLKAGEYTFSTMIVTNEPNKIVVSYYMLNAGSHPYPHESYYGSIVRQKDLEKNYNLIYSGLVIDSATFGTSLQNKDILIVIEDEDGDGDPIQYQFYCTFKTDNKPIWLSFIDEQSNEDWVMLTANSIKTKYTYEVRIYTIE